MAAQANVPQNTQPSVQKLTHAQSLAAVLGDLIGVHRQLLEAVRAEKTAITDAKLGEIQELTLRKESLLEQFRVVERSRLSIMVDLARHYRQPAQELTLSRVIALVQNDDQHCADQLRSLQAALSLLIDRIRAQSDYNRGLIDRSLEHLEVMKTNVLGEKQPKSQTYNPRAQRTPQGAPSAKLLSTEV